MKENPIRDLLAQGNWGEDQALLQGLRQWQYAPVLWQPMRPCRRRLCFTARCMAPATFTGFFSWRRCSAGRRVRRRRWSGQVFRAASYHDVGRTFDGYDIYHGARSALRLAALTGQTGEALVELQAAVTAHSRPDREMASIVASFQPRDLPHAMALTRLLKDADNLDRVRLGDLDPKFLRHDSAKDLVGFAQRLFQRDQAAREP